MCWFYKLLHLLFLGRAISRGPGYLARYEVRRQGSEDSPTLRTTFGAGVWLVAGKHREPLERRPLHGPTPGAGAALHLSKREAPEFTDSLKAAATARAKLHAN